MALLTPLDLDEAKRLGREHGLEISAVEPLELGSVNSNFRVTLADGRVLFGRIYEEQGEDGARAELALLAALAPTGVPVPLSIPTESGRLATAGGKPFALFPWLRGESLCLGRVRPEHCRTVGRALARVHLASGKVVPLGPGRFGPTDMIARLERVAASANRPDLEADIGRVRSLLEHYRELREPELPSGIVHGDLFRDNVLWALPAAANAVDNSAPELVALLDFESAFHGPFLYDLLVTISAWCYRDEFLPELVRALGRGYQEERALSELELASLRVEGALACLRFATTRITDFSLRTAPGGVPARDYRRFLARLSAIEGGALDELVAGR